MARKTNNNNKKNLKGFTKASFARLVREIGNDVKSDLLWDSKAFQALQEASEQMLEQRFDRAGRLASMCKVDTVTRKHMVEAA